MATAKGSVKSATNTSDAKGKPKRADWELIERDYRAGVKSIRELGKDHGVSDTAIRKKAMSGAWTRDLTVRVQERVRTKLVRTRAPREPAEPREPDPETEQDIIEQAAEQVVTVVRSHRKRIHRQTELVDLLTQQLVDVAGRREDFEEAIEEETADDSNGKRRAVMLKAVSLSTHASTAVNLANALKVLVGMERQAFNIKDESESPPSILGDLLKQVSGTGLPIVKDEADE